MIPHPIPVINILIPIYATTNVPATNIPTLTKYANFAINLAKLVWAQLLQTALFVMTPITTIIQLLHVQNAIPTAKLAVDLPILHVYRVQSILFC